MSSDTRTPFERALDSLHPKITPIASRQPALNPARHHVSPAVLEFRLLQMTQERDQLMVALQSVLPLCVQGNQDYEDACALLARLDSQ